MKPSLRYYLVQIKQLWADFAQALKCMSGYALVQMIISNKDKEPDRIHNFCFKNQWPHKRVYDYIGNSL